MRIAVIFNPVARGDKARHFRSHLDQLAQAAVLKPTLQAGHGRQLAAESVGEGFDAIVAAGGDGTVNEVLNGIVDAGGLPGTALGILPLGTTNVFAKELHLPHDFPGAWRTITNGCTTRIDLPFATWTEVAPQWRYFAQMAGAGLDSRAIELVNWKLKKRIGYLAYVVSGLRALLGELPMIEVSNGQERARGQLVLVGNGRFYGGRFNMFPLAELRDGVLEVVIYPRVNLGAVLHGCWGMLSGNFHCGRTLQMRGAHIELRSHARATFHVEGENAGFLPVAFGVEPRALKVIVPGS